MEVEVIPKAADLVAIIALLSQEADGLRERVGKCGIRFHRRVFYPEDLRRGYELCAKVTDNARGGIELHIES